MQEVYFEEVVSKVQLMCALVAAPSSCIVPFPSYTNTSPGNNYDTAALNFVVSLSGFTCKYIPEF